ncbi:MAG: IS110 family transposase [Lentisphaerae bacterium]|nr:IS110 family transposase [Lentisphaerota bacterium]
MRLVREHGRLKGERTAQVNRIRSLLVLHGVRIQGRCLHGFDVRQVQTPDRKPLGEQLVKEIERGQKRLALIEEQINELKRQRESALKIPLAEADRKAAKLCRIKTIGHVTATALSRDFFWRDFRNRREVGSMAGLTGSPYQSGTMAIDQGISKAGNSRIRALMIELAWTWQRMQPQSELTRWYSERLAKGNKRHKHTLIVALARKLLVALWKYLETGEVPAGAVLKVA